MSNHYNESRQLSSSFSAERSVTLEREEKTKISKKDENAESYEFDEELMCSIMANKSILNNRELNKFSKLTSKYSRGIWHLYLPTLYRKMYCTEIYEIHLAFGLSNLRDLLNLLGKTTWKCIEPINNQFEILIFPKDDFNSYVMYIDNEREAFLKANCADLIEQLHILSKKYVNTWTTLQCIEPYEKYNFSSQLIMCLLAYYDIIQVILFQNTYLIYFKQIFSVDSIQMNSNHNFVDLKYELEKTLEQCTFSENDLLCKFDVKRLFSSDENIKLRITNIDSPDLLSVLIEQNRDLEILHKQMQNLYKHNFSIFKLDESHIKPYTACVVKQGDFYLRGIISAVISETEVKVYLADINWMKIKNKNNLFCLHSMFAKLHFHGFRIQLGHITKVVQNRAHVESFLKNKILFASLNAKLCYYNEETGIPIVKILLEDLDENGRKLYLHEVMHRDGLIEIEDTVNCSELENVNVGEASQLEQDESWD